MLATINAAKASDWDSFLEQCPFGQFQQSSSWASVKAKEGWQSHRVAFEQDSRIRGGFQMLWKPTVVGNIGYISKGPASNLPDLGFKTQLAEAVLSAASEKRLAVLIVQPPDHDFELHSILIDRGLVQAWNDSIIDATCLLDLSEGMERLHAKMRSTTRAEIRQAVRRGVTVREGTIEDAPIFFRLMRSTCERQKTKPNPPNENVLSELWSAFRSRKQIRLTLAERDGAPIAGLLSICFGNRITLWKKGSLPEQFGVHAMPLLYRETLDWACRSGFHFADFVALRRRIAIILLAGEKLGDRDRRSRDFFNLGFGAKPVLLPSALIWARNPVLHFGNRVMSLLRRSIVR